MGYAGALSPCGCRHAQMMGATERWRVEHVRCPEHYDPVVDDPKILEAAQNKAYWERRAWAAYDAEVARRKADK